MVHFSLQSQSQAHSETSGPGRKSRVTCLFLDTRFTGNPAGVGHQDPRSSYLPPFVRLPWCLVLDWEVLEQREGLVWGLWWDAATRVRNAPSLAGSWKPLCSSGVFWPAQSRGWERKLWCRHRRCCLCAWGWLHEPLQMQYGKRAAVPDLSGKERVKPGAGVGSSPDTSADPLCDHVQESSASQALPFLIYKVETATSISAGLHGNYSSNASQSNG